MTSLHFKRKAVAFPVDRQLRNSRTQSFKALVQPEAESDIEMARRLGHYSTGRDVLDFAAPPCESWDRAESDTTNITRCLIAMTALVLLYCFCVSMGWL